MKTLSKIIEFHLNNSTIINVQIIKKRMKNMRLSISKTGSVKVSIPYHTTYGYAYQFLVRKRDWINTQLNKISINLSKDSCNFIDGGNVFLLGKSYPLKVQLSNSNKVVYNTTEQCVIIYVKNETIDIKNVFLKWCKKYFLDFFTNRLNYIYLQMFKSSTPPAIKIKTMKSMWGNCNFVKKIITLNLYLSKTPIECIDYVIVHELAHLIHHNHGKEFHALMTSLLPDWKVRKKLLNNYSLTF